MRLVNDTTAERVQRQGRTKSPGGGEERAKPYARRSSPRAPTRPGARAPHPRKTWRPLCAAGPSACFQVFYHKHVISESGGESQKEVAPGVEGCFRACWARVILCSGWVSGRSDACPRQRGSRTVRGTQGRRPQALTEAEACPAAQDATSQRERGPGRASTAPGSCPRDPAPGRGQLEPAEDTPSTPRGRARFSEAASGLTPGCRGLSRVAERWAAAAPLLGDMEAGGVTAGLGPVLRAGVSPALHQPAVCARR